MQQICRTCLQKITDFNFVILNNDSRSLQVVSQLSLCVPEMDLNTIKDPILCGICVSILQLAANFKNNCLKTEDRIWNCKQNKDLDSNSLDILDVYGQADDPEFFFTGGKDSVIKIEYNTIKEEPMDQFLRDDCNILGEELELNDNIENNVPDETNFENNVKIIPPNVENCYIVLTRLDETRNSTESSQDENDCNTEWHDTENLFLHSNILTNLNTDLQNTEILPQEANSSNQFTQKLKKSSTLKCAITAEPKSSYTCNICAFKTKYKRQFNVHIKTHNSENALSLKQSKYGTRNQKGTRSTKKHLVSSKCDFKTAHRWSLLKHRKCHTDQKSHKNQISCEVCGKCFVRKCSLIQHEKIHTFNCKFCKAKFAYENMLKRHIKTHLHQKNVGNCNTAKQPHYKGTRLIYNGGIPHTCTVCKRNYIVKGNLINHQRIHNNELTCAMCNVKFSSNNVFLRHLKGHIF